MFMKVHKTFKNKPLDFILGNLKCAFQNLR